MVSTEHILEDLNAPQRDAVTAIRGPVLVLAGPGSGKTRVIAHRIAYLVQHEDIAPWRILAVTFTNKAAREMRARVVAHIGERAADLSLGTFHAICTRLLRVDGARIGLDRAFTIYDDDDQMSLVKRVCEELHVDPKRFHPRAILSSISHAKSELLAAEEYTRRTRSYYEEVISRVYERYQAVLGANNAVDFDDLILRTVQLLQNDSDAREKYQERYVHVLVDEFQDTNIAQYQLARLLAAKHGNICVVGDPDQSIYSWRSADIRNILEFERDFPAARTVLLEQNYRSTKPILDAAHAVITGSKLRKEKTLWTERSGGEALVSFEGYDEQEEAEFVADEIASFVREATYGHDAFAVMYRTNAQSRVLEEAFIQRRIPYRLVGGTRFYERREVRDVLSYLRLIHNPFDVVSFGRIVNVPGRGIGSRTTEDLERWAISLGLPLYTALQLITEQEGPGHSTDTAERHPIAVRQAKALTAFSAILQSLIEEESRATLSSLVDAVLERTQYRRYLLEEHGEEGEGRWENVLELRAIAEEYDTLAPGHALPSFLEDVALISDADTIDEQKDERVTLITLHSAKGLEYPVVFMTAMEEGVLPHARSFDDPAQMEEERRLCYVGMTRAKERLYLLRAFRRHVMGFSQHNQPSRFLNDVPRELLQHRSGTVGKIAPAERRYRDADAPPRDDRPRVPSEAVFSAGEKVRHPRFGEGIVVSCVVTQDDQEVTVAFKGDAKIKKLLLSFAPLDRVERAV